MNATEYKKFHESYMQNNHGSTATHTFFCIFFTVQCSIICAITEKKNGLIQYVHEYVIIILSMVIIHTVLFEYVSALNFVAFIFLLFKIIRRYNAFNLDELYKCNNSNKNTRIHSITCLRALTYLITGLCILAVDFKDFPRSLAKTEGYGYSLMDTGVGLFVLMSGLVHKEANESNYLDIVRQNGKFILILLVLGIARFVSIKQLEYHEHVTEYGVHWNFFFTLAICKFLSTLLLLLSKNALLLSISLIITHEFLLYAGLQEWVFSNTKRVNIFDANREGISSSLGYVALYLFAAHLKSIFNKKDVSQFTILKRGLYYSLILIVLTYFTNIFRPISRTLANTGYCVYLATLLATILTIMYFIEIVANKKQASLEVPLLLDAINYNGLVYFLISNLSTGIINMSTQTLLMSSLPTFILLNVYMIFNIVVIVYLKKIKFKI